MRLWKVLQSCPHRYVKRCWQGVLSVVFLFFFCQTVSLVVLSYGFFSVCNRFGAFSISFTEPFFSVGICAVLFFFGVQWWKETDVFSVWAWLLLFSGGLSNASERIVFGCVTDYIRFGSFPAFNVADTLLTMGVIGIVLRWWIITK